MFIKKEIIFFFGFKKTKITLTMQSNDILVFQKQDIFLENLLLSFGFMAIFSPFVYLVAWRHLSFERCILQNSAGDGSK